MAVPFTIGDVTYSPEQFESLWGSQFYLDNPRSLDFDKWAHAYSQATKAYSRSQGHEPGKDVKTTITPSGRVRTSFGNWPPERAYNAYLQNSQTGRNAPYWENTRAAERAIREPIMNQLYGPVGQGNIYDEPARLASEKYKALQETPQTTPMGEQVAPPTPTQGMAGTQAGPSPMGDESQKGVVPGFRRIRKPGWEDSTSSYAFTYEHMPTGQIYGPETYGQISSGWYPDVWGSVDSKTGDWISPQQNREGLTPETPPTAQEALSPRTTIMGEQVAPPTPTQALPGTQAGPTAAPKGSRLYIDKKTGAEVWKVVPKNPTRENMLEFNELWETGLTPETYLQGKKDNLQYPTAQEALSPRTTIMGEQVAPPTPTQGMAGTQAGPMAQSGSEKAKEAFENWLSASGIDPAQTSEQFPDPYVPGAPMWEREYYRGLYDPASHRPGGPRAGGDAWDLGRSRSNQAAPRTTIMGEQVAPQLPTQALPGTQAGPPPVSERLRRLTDPNLQAGLPGAQSGAPVYASEALRRQADPNIRRSRSGINEFLREKRTELQPTIDAISQAATTAKEGLSQAASDVSNYVKEGVTQAGFLNLPTVAKEFGEGLAGFNLGSQITPQMRSTLQDIVAKKAKYDPQTGKLTGGIDYRDYPGIKTDLEGKSFTGAENARAWLSPEFALATTLGKADFSIDPATGKVNWTGGTPYTFPESMPASSLINRGGITRTPQDFRPDVTIPQGTAMGPIQIGNVTQSGVYDTGVRPQQAAGPLASAGILAGRKRAIGQALTPGVRGTGGAFGRYRAALGG